MVDFTSEEYINSTLEIGAVYYFEASDILGTTEPHYFVIVAIDEEDNYMVLSTTQREKKEAYFAKKGLDLSTLVYIKNDDNNGLTEGSYFNCNDKYSITKEKLIEKRDDGTLVAAGNISYSQYDQIRTGIKESALNDLPHELLVHPKD